MNASQSAFAGSWCYLNPEASFVKDATSSCWVSSSGSCLPAPPAPRVVFPMFILNPLWHSSETSARQFNSHKNNTDKDARHFGELNWLSKGYKKFWAAARESGPAQAVTGAGDPLPVGSKPRDAAGLRRDSNSHTVMVSCCILFCHALCSKLKGTFLTACSIFFLSRILPGFFSSTEQHHPQLFQR